MRSFVESSFFKDAISVGFFHVFVKMAVTKKIHKQKGKKYEGIEHKHFLYIVNNSLTCYDIITYVCTTCGCYLFLVYMSITCIRYNLFKWSARMHTLCMYLHLHVLIINLESCLTVITDRWSWLNKHGEAMYYRLHDVTEDTLFYKQNAEIVVVQQFKLE